MAAPAGNSNAIGNRGGGSPNKTNRVLASEVRELGLKQILHLFRMKAENKMMSDYEKEMHRELLIKMAPNFIPKLQEITGDDGAPIPILGYTSIPLNKDVPSNNSPTEASQDDQTDPSSSGRDISEQDNRDKPATDTVQSDG